MCKASICRACIENSEMHKHNGIKHMYRKRYLLYGRPKTCLLCGEKKLKHALYRTLSSSPCISLIVKAAVFGLRRRDVASMVTRIPWLVMIKLILRLLVFFFIVTNSEWLVQIVSLGLVDVVDAVWVVSFSHLFRSAFVIGICFAAALSVFVHGAQSTSNLHEMLLLNLIPSRSTFLASSDTLNLFCLVIFNDQVN